MKFQSHWRATTRCDFRTVTRGGIQVCKGCDPKQREPCRPKDLTADKAIKRILAATEARMREATRLRAPVVVDMPHRGTARAKDTAELLTRLQHHRRIPTGATTVLTIRSPVDLMRYEKRKSIVEKLTARWRSLSGKVMVILLSVCLYAICGLQGSRFMMFRLIVRPLFYNFDRTKETVAKTQKPVKKALP